MLLPPAEINKKRSHLNDFINLHSTSQRDKMETEFAETCQTPTPLFLTAWPFRWGFLTLFPQVAQFRWEKSWFFQTPSVRALESTCPSEASVQQNLQSRLWALGQMFSPHGFFYSDLRHQLSDVTGGRSNISEMGRQTPELKVKGQTEVFCSLSHKQTKSINKLKGLQAVYNQILIDL